MKNNAPCLTCKHMHSDDYKKGNKLFCRAFSDYNVPQEIRNGEDMHEFPKEGQMLQLFYAKSPYLKLNEPLFKNLDDYEKYWSPCSRCEHFDENMKGCPAFGTEIPWDLVSETGHKVPFDGQNVSDVCYKKK